MNPAFEHGISNGLAPIDQVGQIDPRALITTFDFSASGNAQEFNYYEEQSQGKIGAVQTLYVDNTENPNPIVFVFSGTGQRLKVPANCGGYFPILTPTQLRGTVQTTAGVEIQVAFINVPMPLQTFGPQTINITNLNVSAAPAAISFTDHSGNTTAGASTQFLAINLTRLALIISNPPTNAESIWYNFTDSADPGAAAGAIPLAPGQSFVSQNVISTQAINIYSVNAVPVVVKEGA